MSKPQGTGQLPYFERFEERITIRLPTTDVDALEDLQYNSVSLAVRDACHGYLTDQLETDTLLPAVGRHDPLGDAEKTRRVTLRLSSSLLTEIEDYADRSNAKNRCNVIRIAIRYLLRREDGYGDD